MTERKSLTLRIFVIRGGVADLKVSAHEGPPNKPCCVVVSSCNSRLGGGSCERGHSYCVRRNSSLEAANGCPCLAE